MKIVKTLFLSFGLFGLSVQAKELKTEANKKGVRVGAAVNIQVMRSDSDPRYRQVLKDEFQIVVNENGLKWNEVHPERSRYDWSKGDELYSLAKANGQRMRGHTLVWHSQIANYMNSIDDKDEMRKAIREHVRAVVTRYKGKVAEWDVVNEALHPDSNNGGFRDSKLFRVLGEEFIEIAFEEAAKADPDALLYYNDYSVILKGPKSDAAFKLIQRLRAKGLRVDGMGIQSHISWPFDDTNLKSAYENFKRFSDAGIKLAMTEVDVFPFQVGHPELEARRQKIYRQLAKLCGDTPSCDQFVTWGITDKYSWVPGHFGGKGDALLFDREYRKKGAYFAARDGFKESKGGDPVEPPKPPEPPVDPVDPPKPPEPPVDPIDPPIIDPIDYSCQLICKAK